MQTQAQSLTTARIIIGTPGRYKSSEGGFDISLYSSMCLNLLFTL